MSEQAMQEDSAFMAVWHADCMLTPRLRRSVQAPPQKTILLAGCPSRLKGNRAAYWIYLDGYTAEVTESPCGNHTVERWRRSPFAAFAPGDEKFLFALAAARSLNLSERAWPLPFALMLEEEYTKQGTYQVHVRDLPGGLPLAYAARLKRCRVSFGSQSSQILRVCYSHEDLWANGQCWETRLENWCYFPVALPGIAIYSQPPGERSKCP